METIRVLLISLTAFCGLAGATNNNGVLYPFEINSLLECHIPNPFYKSPGEPLTRPGPLPRIPFDVPVVRSDGFFGPPGRSVPYEVYLPQESGFRMPSLRDLKEDELLQFLGDDFNGVLTSIDQPPSTRVAPKACDLLPALEGSAGQQLIHVEMADEFLSLLQTDDMDGGQASLVYNQTANDDPTTQNVPGSSDFLNDDFDRFFRAVSETNSHEELCDIWIGRCPLVPRWEKLPDSYFPRYLAQSLCSGKNCSIPRGLTCQEDFQYSVYVTVLRWDCCFNHLNLETRWDCGWRKVQIPIFCDCTCGCKEVPPHT